MQKMKLQKAKQVSQSFGNVECEPLCFQFICHDCVYINLIINKISRFFICARIVLYSGLRMNLFNNNKKNKKNLNLNASIHSKKC